MWRNFCEMPLMMKFMILHALIFGVGGILSILPILNYSIGGSVVTYSEWWSTGTGFQFIFIALAIGYAALKLLKRNRLGRIVYLSALSIVLFLNVIFSVDQLSEFSMGIGYLLFLCALYWYLFKKESVVAYFESSTL